MAWNGSDGKIVTVEPIRSPQRKGLWLWAALIVVIVGALVFWLFTSTDSMEEVEVEKSNKGIHEVAPADTHKDSKATADTATKQTLPTAKSGARQNATKGGEIVKVSEDAQEDASTNRPPVQKRLFPNMMDQLLAMAMPKNPGEPMPPLPIADGQKFPPELEEKMLERLAVADDDTEHTLDAKERVQAMRDEYFELKKRGWSFVDYLKACQAKVALDAEVKHESLRMNEEAFLSKGLSDADYRAFLDKINTVLNERGIPPIHPTVSGQREDEEGNPLPPDQQHNEENEP